MSLGGDEVVTQCWSESATVQSYMKQHNMSIADLYTMFETRVHAIAAKHNKDVMAWDEVTT